MESASYSSAQILTALKSQKATPLDYLIRTYFKIFHIAEGPFYHKHKIRFNNITFNDFAPISDSLTRHVFLKKSKQLLETELNSVEVVSCIVPNFGIGTKPVFCQFFSPTKGIQYRLLDYILEETTCVNTLTKFSLIPKVVSYCGDYCFREPKDANRSDVVASLRVLSRKEILEIPYSDRFIPLMFDLVGGYLPEDVINCVDKLGDILSKRDNRQSIINELVLKYKNWNRNEDYILRSQYFRFIVNNLDALSVTLQECQFLPSSISEVFRNHLHRFFLIFVKEIFDNVDSYHFFENSAVAYYFYLVKLKKLFEVYEDKQFFPEASLDYFRKIVEELELSKNQDNLSGCAELDTILATIIKSVNEFFTRCVCYVSAVISQFEYISLFSWVTFRTPLDCNQLSMTYQFWFKQTLLPESFAALVEEVKDVNELYPRLNLGAIQTIGDKWVLVLQYVRAPLITDLLKLVLSLPASVEVMPRQYCVNATERMVRVIQSSFQNVSQEQVVDNAESFFRGFLQTAKDVIRRNQTVLID